MPFYVLPGRRPSHPAGVGVAAPWRIAVGGDLAVAEVPGRRTRAGELVGRYLYRLQLAAARDPALAVAFTRVAGLMAPPASLLRPDLAVRVAADTIRHRSAAAGVQ